MEADGLVDTFMVTFGLSQNSKEDLIVTSKINKDEKYTEDV